MIFMADFEHHAIRFLVKEGQTTTQTEKLVVSVFKEEAPKYSTVAKWAAEFKRGCSTLQACGSRSGRLSEVTTPDKMPGRAAHIVWSSEQSRQVAAELDRCEQHHAWLSSSIKCLQDECRRTLGLRIGNSESLVSPEKTPRIFGNGRWLVTKHASTTGTPESKEASKQWKTRDEPAPKKFPTQPVQGK